jgi:hypothetical protein|tara:strand:- start:2651 stop:3061 length:411 start_codon:yes stop_codon:yes gene_type:complete
MTQEAEGNIKFLKLTNGEQIIVTTDEKIKNYKDKKSIDVLDAVQIGTIKIPSGQSIMETYTMSPWIRIAKEDIISIPTDSIVVMTELDDDAVVQYQTFIKDYDENLAVEEDKLEKAELEDEHYDTKRDKKFGKTFH